MSDYEFTVSLRIRHPTIDPTVITCALGIQPQHSWQAGQPRCNASAELGGTHHDSYWIGRLMAEPLLSGSDVSVEKIVLQTLNQMRRAQPFLARLHDESGVAELLVSLYARDVFRLDLPSESLALLGRLHLAITLEIHPHSPLHAASRSN